MALLPRQIKRSRLENNVRIRKIYEKVFTHPYRNTLLMLNTKKVVVNTLHERNQPEFKIANLRRNFRNAKPIYELVHLIYECGFDSKKIPSVYTKNFLTKKNSSTELDLVFDISDAKFPSLLYIDDDINLQYDQPYYHEQLIQKLATEYGNLILSQFNLNDHKSNDILILVPDTTGDDIRAVRIALKNLYENQYIGFIDYVEKKSRKYIAPEGKLRIVTFHSSRGLEASKVLIFGIEKLQLLSRVTGGDLNNLGYITISRAIFDLTVCIRSNKTNQVTKFIEDAMTYIISNYG